ncbi:PEPxxWA-CTERM sorting domain-containing protein [Phenylobacterium sp.]|uniref:PEPxxWA-CTERM sorting domain-containing protein n=1 Tax=Phenylobacterium sp. TaxID=1871053 RepID=UPI0025DE516C|nr:PEPxxWA-CTERM sorting domain-containing protein [Phenylobacterium sp.]MBX3485420.1 PEPxxWA-CTERM sorting domain-containing protein [Phenylobacterium sp.]
MYLRGFAAVVFAATALAGSARATILTFDTDTRQPFSSLIMDQAYGDRVTALTMGKFQYGIGLGDGLTPNVTVAYSGGTPGAILTRWNADYGDLVNVLTNDDDGDTVLRILFTADEGYTVKLFGFDLAGWNHSDYTLPGLTVTSGDAVLYAAEGVHVEGANGHSTFDFGLGLSGRTLAIDIDLTGLGFDSDNIGIDNIRFGQSPPGVLIDQPPSTVPEPAAWATMLLGFLTIGAAARRRRTTWASRFREAGPAWASRV